MSVNTFGPEADEKLALGYEGDAFVSQLECPVCRGFSALIARTTTINPEVRSWFDMRQCNDCRHWWINPLPLQPFLNHLYEAQSLSVVGAVLDQPATAPPGAPHKMVLNGEADSPPGRFFEIGVGQGLLFQAFRRRGWQCEGVEPGCGWANRVPGVVRHIDEVTPGKIFDVIAAIDVLEHLQDPVDTLKCLRRFASPGSRLYCSFPNRDSARARVHKQRWRMVRPLGHLHFFSRRSVLSALNQGGWRAESVQATDVWSPRQILTPWGIPTLLSQLAGFGDQWMVRARAA